MTSGTSLPSCAATVRSACCIAVRPASVEKSVNGSLWNSGSAIAHLRGKSVSIIGPAAERALTGYVKIWNGSWGPARSRERTSAAIRSSIAAPPTTTLLPRLHLHLLLLLFLGHFCHPLLCLSTYTAGTSQWECDREARSPASAGGAIMVGGGDCDHEGHVG